MRTLKKKQSSGEEEEEARNNDGDDKNKKRKVKKLTKQPSTSTKQYNQFDNNDRSVQTVDLGLKVNFGKNK
jgi:sRNA-binding protein